MDIDETIEVVDYYLDTIKDGLPSDLRIISTPLNIVIIDGYGARRPDRYTITKDAIGDERYARLLTYKTN